MTEQVEERLSGRTSEAQAARTDRMIRAAIELAGQGGYEAVQMREVARIAGVALATLYRYYPSKNELLLAAVRYEMGKLSDDVHTRPPRAATPERRAGEVFARAFQAMRNDPGFAHAALSVRQSPAPFGAHEATQPAPTGTEYTFVDMAARAAWGRGHRVTAAQRLALQMVESLWISGTIDWLNGRLTADAAVQRIRLAAEKLLT
ncbi:TetR family transcriptional regulator [Candidatus Blastococcus massiliensis]|uniref:TetR family transcriptional regulator n=1 Tax=Candidatus Blastococcus massiliensis TaxID=1470358 RepID=UPI0004ACE942|nr:TetR family transcriptional regulator [Candidatus Blastococcus massiliensis]